MAAIDNYLSCDLFQFFFNAFSEKQTKKTLWKTEYLIKIISETILLRKYCPLGKNSYDIATFVPKYLLREKVDKM